MRLPIFRQSLCNHCLCYFIFSFSRSLLTEIILQSIRNIYPNHTLFTAKISPKWMRPMVIKMCVLFIYFTMRLFGNGLHSLKQYPSKRLLKANFSYSRFKSLLRFKFYSEITKKFTEASFLTSSLRYY